MKTTFHFLPYLIDFLIKNLKKTDNFLDDSVPNSLDLIATHYVFCLILSQKITSL